MKSQSSRLHYVLSKLSITPYQFSKDLGYKSPDSIYHVLNGLKKISENMVNRIKLTDYDINTDWLVTGVGIAFVKRLKKGEYADEYFSKGMVIYPARLNFFDVKRLGVKLSETIYRDPEHESYSVKARAFLIEGLEFIFSGYAVENGKRYYTKLYALSISPNWRITNFYDYWRVEENTRRCENLFKLRGIDHERLLGKFETKMRDILDEFDDSYFEADGYEPTRFDSSHTDKYGFVELYETDGRK